MVVRDCTLDNGGTTKDVEIGSLDHCGWIKTIKFEEEEMRGCLTVCEHDGCNRATATSLYSLMEYIVIAVVMTAISHSHY